MRIAIIGGGPAGSTLALGLIARGVDPGDLIVIDRARFPRPKLCGGGITFRGTEVIAGLIGEPKGGAHTRAIHFRAACGEVEIQEKGGQWIFDRGVLDDALLSEVKRRGVEVREEETITAIEPGVDGWRVKSGARTETFAWVAGADGACGLSRRASGLRGGITGRLVEAVFEPIDEAPDPSRLYFDFDPVLDGIPGYAWVFPYPCGTNQWKLGVMDGRGRVPGSELRKWTMRFAERRGFRLVEDKLAGWPERYFDAWSRGHRPGLVLVGEAFGIDPLLGEGIAPSLFHALYSAVRIKGALDQGTTTIRGFEAGFLATPEGRNLRFQSHLADRIYGTAGARWLRVLFDLPRLRELAGRGEDRYGRLARHAPTLIGSLVYHVMRRGFPKAA